MASSFSSPPASISHSMPILVSIPLRNIAPSSFAAFSMVSSNFFSPIAGVGTATSVGATVSQMLSLISCMGWGFCTCGRCSCLGGLSCLGAPGLASRPSGRLSPLRSLHGRSFLFLSVLPLLRLSSLLSRRPSLASSAKSGIITSSSGFWVRRTIASFLPIPSMPRVSCCTISISTSSIESPSSLRPLNIALSTVLSETSKNFIIPPIKGRLFSADLCGKVFLGCGLNGSNRSRECFVENEVDNYHEQAREAPVYGECRGR